MPAAGEPGFLFGSPVPSGAEDDVVCVVGACSAGDRAPSQLINVDGPGPVEQCGDLAWANPFVRVEAVCHSGRAVAGVVTDDEQGAPGGDSVHQGPLGVVTGRLAQRRILRGDKVKARFGQFHVQQSTVHP